jgi:tyrosyl-tRNA synthetase
MPNKRMKAGKYSLIELLVDTGLVPSKSEARRLIAQKGVKIDQKPIQDDTVTIGSKGIILQAGKRKFIRITT